MRRHRAVLVPRRDGQVHGERRPAAGGASHLAALRQPVRADPPGRRRRGPAGAAQDAQAVASVNPVAADAGLHRPQLPGLAASAARPNPDHLLSHALDGGAGGRTHPGRMGRVAPDAGHPGGLRRHPRRGEAGASALSPGHGLGVRVDALLRRVPAADAVSGRV